MSEIRTGSDVLEHDIRRPRYSGRSRSVDPTRDSLVRGRTEWWDAVEALASDLGLKRSELFEIGVQRVAESVGRKVPPRL